MTLETSHIGKGCDRDTYNLASQRQLCGASDLAIDLLPDPQQVRSFFFFPSSIFLLLFPLWINPFIIVVYSLGANGQLAYNVTKASPTMPVWLVLMGKLELVFPSLWCHLKPFLTINSPLPHGCDIVITKHWKNTSRNISFVKLMIIVSVLYSRHTIFQRQLWHTPQYRKFPLKSLLFQQFWAVNTTYSISLVFQARIVITWPFSYATANSSYFCVKNTKKAKKTLSDRLNGDGNCLKSVTTSGTTMLSTSTSLLSHWWSMARNGLIRKTIRKSLMIGHFIQQMTSPPGSLLELVGKVNFNTFRVKERK